MPNDFFNQGGMFATAPTPGDYSQLAKDQNVGTGSTRAVALPPMVPGFVVGRSTLNGAPVGYEASAVATQINIDPDVPGEGFTVDMSLVSPDAFNIAARAAKLGEAVSIEDLRDRASSIYRTLSDQASVPVQGEEEMQEGRMAPLSMPAEQPTTPADAASAVISPMLTAPNTLTQVKEASFTQSTPEPAPPQQQQQRQVAVPVVQQPTKIAPPQVGAPSLFDQVSAPSATKSQARTSQGGAPTFKVTFEIKGSPMSIEAWYHDVIRNDHVLVLVYDTRCVGYPRTRLQPTESDIAVHIDGSDAIYLVQDPSISYMFDGQEFQVLLIKETHPLGGVAVTEEN